MNDQDRESAIDVASMQMAHAKTPAQRRYWWNEMKTLIEGRSARAVEKLERERGIHKEQQP
jgi:hypothetical protein